jgi:hypothetical protein
LSHYGNFFYYLRRDGIVYKNNHTFSNETKLYNETLSAFNPVSDYSILVSGSTLSNSTRIAVIERNNKKLFWYLNKDNESPTQISDSVEGAQFSWDLKKIMLRFTDKILVYYIDTIEEQPRHEAGEKEIIFTSDLPIKNAQWLTQQENYIVVTRENFIDIVEMDERDKRNIIRFISLTDIKNLFYYKNQKAIYALDGSELKRMALDY